MLFFKANQRNSSRVLLTLDMLNLKSIVHPCADRLMFRDPGNDLTFLGLSSSQLKNTGNYTSTRSKGYLCHPQLEVYISTNPIKNILIKFNFHKTSTNDLISLY